MLKIPIYHLIGSTRIGGAERQFVTLLRAFDRETFDHRVGVFRESGPLTAELSEVGVEVDWFEFRHRQMIPFLVGLRATLKSAPFAVFHVHLHTAAIFGRIAAQWAGIPAILYTEHSDIRGRSAALHRVESLLSRRTCRTITVSRVQRDLAIELEGKDPERVVFVPNSVPIREIQNLACERDQVRKEWGLTPSDVVLGTVANLREEKRLQRLISAFAHLKKRGHVHRLVLVGDGAERGMLEGEVQRLQLEPYVRFVGQSTRAIRFMQGFDIYAVTSRIEGMPVSLLEAMASGLPSVCTRVGGIPDLAQDEMDTILVPNWDETIFVEAVQRLAVDPALRKSMGAHSLETVSRSFSADSNARRIEALYLECLEGKGVLDEHQARGWAERWGQDSE